LFTEISVVVGALEREEIEQRLSLGWPSSITS